MGILIMKNIAIYYSFSKGPSGGANQFLKFLGKEFARKGILASSSKGADGVLLNCSPAELRRVLLPLIYFKICGKKIGLRIDGPISLVRDTKYLDYDKMIACLIKLNLGTPIFQSKWSLRRFEELTNIKVYSPSIVYNIPDFNIFFPRDYAKPRSKVRLINASWSSNSKKGFKLLTHAAETLSQDDFEVYFIGNAPMQSSKIQMFNAVPSQQLAEMYRQADIFLALSSDDPCSNALIEALACGLPVVFLDSGGHGELVKNAGEAFANRTDLITAILKVSSNLHEYKSSINYKNADEVLQMYYHAVFSPELVTKQNSVFANMTVWSELFYYTSVAWLRHFGEMIKQRLQSTIGKVKLWLSR